MLRLLQGNAEQIPLADESVDLTVTSPPYDDLRSYNGYEFEFKSVASELFRVTKQSGVLVWVVGDAIIDGSESGTSFRQALYFKEIGFRLHDTMIYQKNSPAAPDSNRYFQIFEYMFVFSKGQIKTFNPIEDRKNKWPGSWGTRTMRGKDGILIPKGKFVQTKQYGVRFNIWRYNTGKGFTTKDIIAFGHPAIFPEKLASDHIRSWSNPGDLVFDPMCGSGTTLKMAKQLGRNGIGMDISRKYAELSAKRLIGVQLPMFEEMT